MTDDSAKKSTGKTARVKKVAYAGKEPDSDFHLEILNITLPSPQQLKDLQIARHLSDEQIHELSNLLQHVHEDLERFNAHYSKVEERKDHIKALIEVEGQFLKLKNTLDKHLDILDKILPLDMMEDIGEGLDLSFAREALDDKTSYHRLNADINRHMLTPNGIDAETISTLTLPRPPTYGLNQGHLLLKHFVDEIQNPLSVWVNLHSDNGGGRPRKYAREYLLFWLAHQAEQLTGKKAPGAKKGSFADYCRSVVEICGLPSQGTDAALPGIVREVKLWKKRFANHD
mgnify:CR=1 FL=1